MRILSAIILILSASISFGQDQAPKVYSWEEVKDSQRPDTVFAISLSKLKLTEVPAGLQKFTALQFLDLSKNKLEELPGYIGEFKGLTTLNAERNKLISMPIFLCRLPGVQRVILNRNMIDNLPECIGTLSELEYLDLYDNPIRELPESLTKLKKLKELDLSGIRFSPSFQNSWILKLPNTKIVFDAPCDCME